MAEKDVMLYSGGMDSYIGAMFLKAQNKDRQIVPMYVNYKEPLCAKELTMALFQRRDVAKNKEEAQFLIRSDEFNFNGKSEGAFNVLFGRNLHFCLLAAPHTNKYIYLFGTKDGLIADNNLTFYEKASDILSHIKGEEVIVTSPFYHLTKAEIVDWYVEQNGQDAIVKLVTQTSSCISPNHLFCGKCSGCFNFFCAVYKYLKMNKWQFLMPMSTQKLTHLDAQGILNKERERSKERKQVVDEICKDYQYSCRSSQS